MGLLDDAIREHLELKRQHGADPTEIARQEREALGPPVRETHEVIAGVAPGEASAGAVPAPPEAVPAAPEPVPAEPEAAPLPPEPEPAAELSHTSQPTAPFDAEQAFVEEDAAAAAAPAEPPLDEPEAAQPPVEPAPVEPAPVEPATPEPGPAPSPPESGSGAVEPPAEPQEPQGEDVLEETPDFLQETPEHDRLWFEQKPPRDFDFDG